jgi:hypothetical protein
MSIRQRASTFATALTLGIAVAAISVGQAEARDNDPWDDGIRCVYYNQETGEMDFYLPGQSVEVYDANGTLHLLICLGDGTWHDFQRPAPRSR